MADLNEALAEILGRINQDRFGAREAPVITATDATCTNSDGMLSGELRVHIKRRSGEDALVDRLELQQIASRAELEDAFAELLSRVLAVHHKWPR
ncbi:MAG: hypothetical protein GKR94_05120 [Gammaproteobacteria bacterium]|nr:hypothetical protein [Gammaproteobacteria bacterium]